MRSTLTVEFRHCDFHVLMTWQHLHKLFQTSFISPCDTVNLCLKVNHTIHLVPSLSRSSLVQPVTFNHTSSPHQIHSKNTSTLLIGCMLKIWRNKTVPTLEITNFCWWLMRLKGRDMHTTVMMTFGFIGAWASMAKECHTVHKCLSCREQRIPTRPYHRLTKIFPTHC